MLFNIKQCAVVGGGALWCRFKEVLITLFKSPLRTILLKCMWCRLRERGRRGKGCGTKCIVSLLCFNQYDQGEEKGNRVALWANRRRQRETSTFFEKIAGEEGSASQSSALHIPTEMRKMEEGK